MAIAVWAIARRRLAPEALGDGPSRVYELLLPLLRIGEEGTRIFNMRRHRRCSPRAKGSSKIACRRHWRSSGNGDRSSARCGRGAADSAPSSPLCGDVPRDQARALPAAFYTSPEYLEFERGALFRTQWICLGHVGAIPNVGDYFTAELADEQLLIVRESAAAVSVLSNICRHRGSPVVTGAGHAARFVCGYHGWTYALDGRLLAAPLIQDGKHFNKAACRLPRFASEIWQGYIFVNLDGSAAPLAPALSSTEPYIRNYHPAEQHFLFETQEVWQTNWKCLVENFMEGYHLSPLHAKTLHPVTPTNLCEKLPNGDAFTGYRANFHPQCPERGPYHADLTPQERRSDVFYCVYPSFVVGFCPHFTLYMCITPATADSVAIRWGVTGIADDPKSPVVERLRQVLQGILRRGPHAARAAAARAPQSLLRPGPARTRSRRRHRVGHHPIHGADSRPVRVRHAGGLDRITRLTRCSCAMHGMWPPWTPSSRAGFCRSRS